MDRKFYKISSFITLVFLLLSTIATPISAQSLESSKDVIQSLGLYEMMEEETTIYTGQDTEKEKVGTFSKSAQIHVLEMKEGFAYFQWGNSIAYVEEQKVSKLAETETAITQITTYDTVSSYIDISKEMSLYDEEQQSIVTLTENEQYPVYDQTEDRFIVLVGNNLAFLNKTDDLVLHTQPENSGESDEATIVEEDPSIIKEVTKDLKEEAAQDAKDDSTSTTEQVREISKQAQIKTTSATVQPSFTSSTKFFEVTADQLTVYDNSSGSLVYVGSLEKGAVFERVGDLGNWHKIKFGTGFGYVWKASTVPAEGANLKLNSKSAQDRTLTANQTLEVFDNSTGSLIRFAYIGKGNQYPIIRDYGNWIEIDFAGRVGYVHKNGISINFKSSDRFFKPLVEHLSVYDNSTGKLVKVGVLMKGQEYPRVGDMGNWHQIKFGTGLGFVWKGSTEPSNGQSIKNKNNKSIGKESFIPMLDLTVYDNTSGKLVPYGNIQKGVSYPLISSTGNWYTVDFSGRHGYVYKPATKLPFKSTDKYFEVLEDKLTIYDNSSGSLVSVGTLVKGQVYPRVSDMGNWHQIRFGDRLAYIWKDSTRPADSSSIKNLNNGLKNSDKNFVTLSSVPVYDNTSGTLVPYVYLKDRQSYPIIEESGNWWKVDVGGRLGYVHKSGVQVGPIFRYTNYSVSMNDMLATQMKKGPQTDKYRNDKTYVHKDFIQLDAVTASTELPTFPMYGAVTATHLNVREGPDTSFWAVGALRQGNRVEILSQSGDWFEIKYGAWRNAKEHDVLAYLNPLNFNPSDKSYFQFLLLSESAGISVKEVNERILFNKGILKNQGQAFINASTKYQVNEIYLISHALLETGNGASALAKGVLVSEVAGKPVEPKIVYNMYGVGAYDSCPMKCGTEFAYKNGWFTPEAAIIGGAEYISTGYINNPDYKQNTLYKMRWNPQVPGHHQYATDIGWAVKQVNNISNLYGLLNNYTLVFDVPVYK
ncbi:SH3 domain-containing protein [Bacillus sp. AK128]